MVVYETDLKGIELVNRGKVRDIYRVGEKLLLVATDRLSAFDVVFPEPVPDKGRVLTQLSLFWFERLSRIVPNHLLETDIDRFPGELRPFADQLQGRAMLVKVAEPLQIECIVRGYISGSGWKAYQKTGEICGIPLPSGLRESDRLPEPIFTPSTKAEAGLHDENISFEMAREIVGEDLAERVRDISIAMYKDAAEYALGKGIIIADTKFEFGIADGELILIDEVLTPDSSRFWPLDQYQPGRSQSSFDKQFVRDYLESIGWDKRPPAPSLPQDIIEKTRMRYLEAYKRLTGRELSS